MRKLIPLIIIIILVSSLLATTYFIANSQLVLYSKATSTNTGISLTNSYVFASPLSAHAGTDEKIRITVFLLDNRGIGIAQKNISLTVDKNLSLTPVSPTTDDTGKAVFEVKSLQAGQFEIRAQTTEGTLPQKVKITFY